MMLLLLLPTRGARFRIIRRRSLADGWHRQGFNDGAESQNRTGDTALFRRVLYRLSYLGDGSLFAVPPMKPRIISLSLLRYFLPFCPTRYATSVSTSASFNGAPYAVFIFITSARHCTSVSGGCI